MSSTCTRYRAARCSPQRRWTSSLFVFDPVFGVGDVNVPGAVDSRAERHGEAIDRVDRDQFEFHDFVSEPFFRGRIGRVADEAIVFSGDAKRRGGTGNRLDAVDRVERFVPSAAQRGGVVELAAAFCGFAVGEHAQRARRTREGPARASRPAGQAVHGDSPLALTSVEYSVLPLLSLSTHSVLRGTHETAFRLLGESMTCVWLGGEANALAGPKTTNATDAHRDTSRARRGRRETVLLIDTTRPPE